MSRAWFHGALLQAGNAQTNVVNLATALHRDALAMQLTRTPGWRSGVFRAIETWPTQMEIWEQWERFYCDVENPHHVADAREFYEANQHAMDDGAIVLWPEVENLYALKCIRTQSGQSAFAREKQSQPIDPERCEFPESYFGEHIWFDDWPQELTTRVMALDPSKGSNARHGDYSAYVMLGIDALGLLFIDADLEKRTTSRMVTDGVRLVRDFRPQRFGVEANQFQELLAKDFTREFATAGLHAVEICKVTNTVSKLVRIRRLEPYLAQRRMRFKRTSPGAQLLVDQLRDFPLASHDDGPDAVEMAIRLATAMLDETNIPDDGLGKRLPVGAGM